MSLLESTCASPSERGALDGNLPYRAIFHASPIGIAVATPEGVLLDVNPALCELLGYARDELTGNNAYDLTIWADPERREQLVQEALAAGAARQEGILVRRKTGEQRCVRLTLEFAGPPEDRKLLVFMVDVTDRRPLKMQDLRGEKKDPSILVVDDEETILNALVDVLALHHFKVYAAPTGLKASSLFTHHARDIDVLVTDITMPLMNGLHLARLLRRFKPTLRVVITTGRGLESAPPQREWTQLGISAVVAKPYRPEEILAAINQALADAADDGAARRA